MWQCRTSTSEPGGSAFIWDSFETNGCFCYILCICITVCVHMEDLVVLSFQDPLKIVLLVDCLDGKLVIVKKIYTYIYIYIY